MGVVLASFSEAAEAPAKKPLEKTVFYFHRTARCPTCLKLESWTREAVQARSTGEQSKTLVFKPVNLDAPENKHFEEDFQLTFSTAVAAEMQEDGRAARWKNLDRIWEYSADEAAFRKYVDGELGAFFNAKP